jgi:hypothetical protein
MVGCLIHWGLHWPQIKRPCSALSRTCLVGHIEIVKQPCAVVGMVQRTETYASVLVNGNECEISYWLFNCQTGWWRLKAEANGVCE